MDYNVYYYNDRNTEEISDHRSYEHNLSSFEKGLGKTFRPEIVTVKVRTPSINTTQQL